jgi:short-subunit dehydrogenase
MNKKTIIVVGASRGIGKAIVEILSSDSTNVVYALSRNNSLLKENFANLENVICKEFDLEKGVRNQLNLIFSETKKVDILINNAGLLVNKKFTELSHEDISASYQTNVIGVMETVQEIVPKMINNGGHIVNISSMGGFQGSVKFPGLSAYSTSKAALCSFTELFAEEFKETKIKMNCLCLGAAQTEMLEDAFPGYKAPISARKMAEYIVEFSLKSHEWMNGKIIPVSISTP